LTFLNRKSGIGVAAHLSLNGEWKERQARQEHLIGQANYIVPEEPSVFKIEGQQTTLKIQK
jgi:hypothetical protein